MKNILITGASRGIGFDTVLELAKNPNHRIYALSRNKVQLQKLVQLVGEKHANVFALPFDLTAVEPFGNVKLDIKKIDILINNAGLLINKPFSALEMHDWRAIFEVNLFGVVRLVKWLLPLLLEADGAHIINIGSMGGVQGTSKFPGLSAYSASKAALANLTECLAEELKEQKIYCNCLALGAVQTEMLASAFPGYKAPVESKDMAQFVAQFCLTAHQFMNGKILPVSVSTP